MSNQGAGARRNVGVVLILLAVVALFLAHLEWNFQVNGQDVVEGVKPPGAESAPFDWGQARTASRVRMAFALIAGAASAIAGVVLLRSRKEGAVRAG